MLCLDTIITPPPKNTHHHPPPNPHTHTTPPRDQKDQLSRECAKEVFLVQLAIAQDYRADPAMAAACKEDVAKYCADVKEGGGRKAACLVSVWTGWGGGKGGLHGECVDGVGGGAGAAQGGLPGECVDGGGGQGGQGGLPGACTADSIRLFLWVYPLVVFLIEE